jgi:hypothetical protein
MVWREVREADLLECLAIEPRHFGAEIVGRDRAITAWKHLIRSRSFNSCVIESASLPGPIIGFGSSVFVTKEFATSEIEDPHPGCNSRIIASIANGKSVVRPEIDLYETPANDALDIATLYGNWLDADLSVEQRGEAQMALPRSFIEQHTGYRLNRVFVESVGRAQCDYVESSGVFRVTRRFLESERHFAVMTREAALSVSGSIAASLFQYREPILALRDGEKHLLAEAMTLRSDGALAARMNVSESSVKKRWQALFEKVADVQPGLLPEEDAEGPRLTRGPQKRHRILAYVRSHPQELRPYRWRPIREN